MKQRQILCLLLALGALMLPLGVGAGVIVASGDVTPVFSLTDTSPNPAVAGNGRFFQNVLGSGTQVAVLGLGVSSADTEINEFYNSLPGVSSSVIAGAVTASALSGINLFLIAIPENDLSAAEVSAVASYVSSGGSLFILGDPSGNIGNVARVNDLLLAIGSGLNLDNSTLEIGPQTASGAQIAVDPLTTGITSFAWGSTAVVTGGTGVFFTSDRSPFIAYEQGPASAVPAPGSLALLGLGLAGLGFSRRKKA